MKNNWTKWTALVLVQTLSLSSYAAEESTLDKAMKWVKEQMAKENPGETQPTKPVEVVPTEPASPPVVETKPSVPVQPPVVETKPSVPAKPPTDTSGETMKGPKRKISPSQNQAIFDKYCIGRADSAEVPQVKYDEAAVRKAADILSKVATTNFYFYSDIRKIYEPKLNPPPAGVTREAHLFLAQTCGEFRDRAEMIAAKIRWVHRMVMLGKAPQKTEVTTATDNIWTQLAGESYMKFIRLSDQIFTMKMWDVADNNEMRDNLHPDAQEPVDGFSVCETKYIISELIGKGQEPASNLADYKAAVANFSGRCSKDDLDYYYDFRGDSNFKQYSPEANAMIWHALSIARFCESPTKAKANTGKITDNVCEDYFKRPFLTRYNAAKSGLAAWMLHGEDAKGTFENAQARVTVVPDFDALTVGLKPFRMNIGGTEIKSNVSIFNFGDKFAEEFGVGTSSATKTNLSEVFERFRNAVNRHTNWYQSSFNDELGHEKSVRDQAYSPFVASSYDMSQSNQFTECGITVPCQGDGRKAWMLVFKIHKDNWYHTRSLHQNKAIDFDRMWFDETSFGTDPLADRERAWDRMGTALEDELDAILYLHNLQAGSGVPVADDKLGNEEP